MRGSDFLTLAKKLATGSTEAEWRSAVSRAYYAAFHEARQLLEDLGVSVQRGDRAHAYLWLRLQNSGHPQIQQAGADLNALRGLRNQADYDLKRPLLQGIAAPQVRLAERIIQALQNAVLQPTAGQITNAMKLYERDVLHEVTWQP
jgi:uncharacterized protein (UPF0332 family)